MKTLAAGLARHGVDVHVIATDDNGPERLSVALDQPITEDGAVYRYFPRQIRPYTCSLPLTTWLWAHVRDYDLVHIHAVFSYASTVAAWCASARGVPYIVRPLGVLNQWGMRNRRPWLKSLSFRLIDRRVLERAAVIQYTSLSEQKEAEELPFHAPAAIVPNPVQLDDPATLTRGAFRKRHPELKGKTIFLFLSRLHEKKGVDLLLPAFARVHQTMPDTALVIAGDGSPALVSSLKQMAAGLGVTPHVVWTGFVQGEEKRSILADADLFVLPSYSENFAVAAVEAMGFRLPLIVSDQVGIHDQVNAHQAGIVIPCQVEALAGALERLAGDPALRRSMGERGAALAHSLYSLDAVCESGIRLYRSLLSGENGR